MNYSSFRQKSQSQKLINSFSSFKPKWPLSQLYILNSNNFVQVLLLKKKRNKNKGKNGVKTGMGGKKHTFFLKMCPFIMGPHAFSLLPGAPIIGGGHKKGPLKTGMGGEKHTFFLKMCPISPPCLFQHQRTFCKRKSNKILALNSQKRILGLFVNEFKKKKKRTTLKKTTTNVFFLYKKQTTSIFKYKTMNPMLVLSNNCNTPLSTFFKPLFLKEINKTVVKTNNNFIKVKRTALKKSFKRFLDRLILRSDKAEQLNQQEISRKFKKVSFLSLKDKNAWGGKNIPVFSPFFDLQKLDATPPKKVIGIDLSYNKLEETLKLLLKNIQYSPKFLLRIQIDSIFTKYLAKTLLGMSSLKLKKAEIQPKSLVLQNYKLFYFDKIKTFRKQSWQEKMFCFFVKKKCGVLCCRSVTTSLKKSWGELHSKSVAPLLCSFFYFKKNKWIQNYLSETTINSSFQKKVRFCSIPDHKVKKWTSSYIQKWCRKFLTNRDVIQFIKKGTIGNMDSFSSSIKKNKMKNKIHFFNEQSKGATLRQHCNPFDLRMSKAEETFVNLNTEKTNTWSQTFDKDKDSMNFTSFFDLLTFCIKKDIKKGRTSVKKLHFKYNNYDKTYKDFFSNKSRLLISNKKVNDILKSDEEESNLIMFQNHQRRFHSLFLMSLSNHSMLANIRNFLTKMVLNGLIQKENKDFLLKLALLDQANNCSESRIHSHFISFDFLPFLNLNFGVKNKKKQSLYLNQLKQNLSTVNNAFILDNKKLQNKIDNKKKSLNNFILKALTVDKLGTLSQNKIKKEKKYKYVFNTFSSFSYNVKKVKLIKMQILKFSFFCKESYKFAFWLKKFNPFLVYKIIPFSFFQDSVFLKRFTKSSFLLTKKEQLITNLDEFSKPNKTNHLFSQNIFKEDQAISSLLKLKFSSLKKDETQYLNFNLLKTLFFSLFFKDPKPFSILSTASDYQYANEFLNVHSNLNVLYALQKWVNMNFSLFGFFLEKQKSEIIPCFSPFLIHNDFLRLNKVQASFLIKPLDDMKLFRTTSSTLEQLVPFLSAPQALRGLGPIFQAWGGKNIKGAFLKKFFQKGPLLPVFTPFLPNLYRLFIGEFFNTLKNFSPLLFHTLKKLLKNGVLCRKPRIRTTTSFSSYESSPLKKKKEFFFLYKKPTTYKNQKGAKKISYKYKNIRNISYKRHSSYHFFLYRKRDFVLKRRVATTEKKNISAHLTLLKKRESFNTINTFLLNKKSNPLLKVQNHCYIFKNHKVKDMKKIVQYFYSFKSKSFANDQFFSKTRTVSEDDLNSVFEMQKNSVYKNYGLNFFGFHIFQTLTFKTRTLNQTNTKHQSLKEIEKVFKNNSLNNTNTQTFKTVILPSHNNIQNQLKKIRQIIFFSKTKTKLQLIHSLAPIIREWCYYYKIVKSQKINLYLDYFTLKTIWRWCCRRHPNKSHQWIQNKYFCQINGQKLVFGQYIPTLSAFVCLPNHTDKF